MDGHYLEAGEDTLLSSNRRAKSNCQSCYQRKTTCDRRIDGCLNCTKMGTTCAYSSPKNTTSQKRGPYNKYLSRKNRELEQKIASLEATVQLLKNQGPEVMELQQPGGPQVNKPLTPVSLENRIDGISRGEWATGELPNDFQLPDISWDNFVSKFDSSYVDRGESRGRIDSPPDRHFNPLSISKLHRSSLHPSPRKMLEYWIAFKERVHPLLMILHAPTVEKCMFDGKRTADDFSLAGDVLRFSIYYSAIVVSSDSQDQVSGSESREHMLRKYSCAIKRILAEPDILASSEILPLQALTIYLYHNQTDDKFTRHSLVGQALRMAQRLGLHRDGTILQKPPYETEMRRRLWWNIHRLERRLAENYLVNAFCVEPHFDTLLPSNINDSEISPADEEPPKPKDGRTEMSFCLIDFEISSLTFDLLKQKPSDKPGLNETKASMIRKCLKILTQRYLNFCNLVDDFDFMIVTYAKLSLSRIWLLAHQPSAFCLDRVFGKTPLTASKEKRGRVRNLLLPALEAFEYASCIPAKSRITKWTWFWDLPNHTLIHLEFYLLAEICYRPCDELGERTWKVLDQHGFQEYIKYSRNTSPDCFEVMLNKIRARARDIRDQSIRSDIVNALSSTTTESIGDATFCSSRGSGTEQNNAVSSPTLVDLPAPQPLSSIDQFQAPELSTQSFILDGTSSVGIGTSLHTPFRAINEAGISRPSDPMSGPSGFSFLNNSAQSTYDASEMDTAMWLQFQDEAMGLGFEDYNDCMWEGLHDLPPME